MTQNLPDPLRRLNAAPIHAAKLSGLRYTADGIPGITRRINGKRVLFYSPQGRRVRDPIELHRIKSLAVPPAWTHVWISPFADSHLQATGRDARGRKQFRYHRRWRELRDQAKYDRLILFGRVLPRLRQRVAKHLALPGLPREKILATIVKLLESTFIRIGNDEYARQNQSFGLTTMRNKHVEIIGSKIRFRFRGKSGIVHDTHFNDRKLARIVRRCQELPGQELFQYLDGDGQSRTINSTDVNEYLREATGVDLTAKDFRTWAGTVLTGRALAELEPFVSKAQAKRNVIKAVESVAKQLGNTRAVCQKCYIHPAIVEAYFDESFARNFKPLGTAQSAESGRGLMAAERAVMAILAQARSAANKKAA